MIFFQSPERDKPILSAIKALFKPLFAMYSSNSLLSVNVATSFLYDNADVVINVYKNIIEHVAFFVNKKIKKS